MKWIDEALCRKVKLTPDGKPDVNFWTSAPPTETKKRLTPGWKTYEENVQVAKAICATCPVRERCLEDVLTAGWNPWGVFGGTTQHERKMLRRRRNAESVRRVLR